MKDIVGQISIFDYIDNLKTDFSWDPDINEIHNQLLNIATKNGLTVGEEEWSVWSHVKNYGYRMSIDLEGTRKQFTEKFYEELQRVVDFAKSKNIELSPYDPMFLDDEESEPMYIYSTFIDKERRKIK